MDYQIVHSITGRFRFRVPKLARDGEFAAQLSGLVESLEFVTAVRINPVAASLVVNYQLEAMATAVQHSVAVCIQKAQGTAITAILTDGSTAEPSIEVDPEVNHWRDLGMPALSLSVALLAVPLELPAIVVGTAIAGAALPWLARATDSLVNRHQPNIDLLDSAWMMLQVAQGQYVAPALKTCLVESRRSLRGTMADHREQQAIAGLAWLEQTIAVERAGQLMSLAAQDLHCGDRVTVRAGELIPVDGWIVAGAGSIDESCLTASSVPVPRTPTQAVYAATIVVAGELEILAERTGLTTRSARVAHLVQANPVHDTQIGIHQAELVKAAIVPTLLLGSTVFAFTGNLGAAISPFQFDFGSGIPISVHTTLLSALTYAARQGIYIRSARILELLCQLDAVVFAPSAVLPSNVDVTVAALHNQGIMVYGVIANQTLEADRDWAETAPDRIVYLISGLQHQGKIVATIGAEALKADIVIALANQSALSSSQADVVIEDWQALMPAITIAKQAMDLVYQNTALIVAPNLLMQIGGGMMLGVNPIWNVFVNNSSAFAAEFVNGIRPFEPKVIVDRPVPPSRLSLPSCEATILLANALQQSELAQRLGVTSQALTYWRSQAKFLQWTQTKDPEGKSWQYDAAEKSYRVVANG